MANVLERARALNLAIATGLIFYAHGPIEKIEAKDPKKIEKVATLKKNANKTDKTKSSDGSSVGPRPAAWCGWWMRTQKGGGPELNVARNWAKRGTPLFGPEAGAVVVWPHHVGIIVAKAEGNKWIVKSGNDSNAVRSRARSLHGAIAFRRV